MIAIFASVVLGAAMAWAGSAGGAELAGAQLFAICGALAFLINWLAFIPAYLFTTERYYDLVGSLTYLLVTALAVYGGNTFDARTQLIGLCVFLWAARLGSFLFLRVQQVGHDVRFNEIKQSFSRYLTAWTLQALWVFLTLSAALAAVTSATTKPIGAIGIAGFTLWVTGFVIEVVADRQKRTFRLDPSNRGRFIRSGLWAWSRHPNYFGEILLWMGIAVVAYPVLAGPALATLVSPFFVYALITKVSGIPLLENSAEDRWGADAQYQAYKRGTPVLFLRPPRR
jgi:steroid 5-alpha reductase family enzyme